MRRSLGPYLIAVAALAVALVLLVLAAPPATQNDDPSSRAAGKAGTLALYDWLNRLGFPLHRITGSFTTGHTDVLLVIDPRVSFSGDDADAVNDFVSRGGDLVLALSPESTTAAGSLLERLQVSLDTVRLPGDAVPAQPFDAADRVHHVPLGAGASIDSTPEQTPLLVQGGAVAAAALQRGSGRAFVVTSSLPFTNDGLRSEDSAMLVLSLLERARGGAIGFDEYHHGEIAASTDGMAAIFGGPLGLALILAVAAVVAYLAISGRHLGRPLPSQDAARVPSAADYIDAMAGLHQRTRSKGQVALRYAEELKQRIRVGSVDPTMDDDAFVAAVAPLRPDLAPRLAAVLLQARQLAAGQPDAAALLRLARDVDDLERHWTEETASASTSAQSRA